MLQGEHSAILLTFIELPFVVTIFVLSIFEWPFYTGFTVYTKYCEYSILSWFLFVETFCSYNCLFLLTLNIPHNNFSVMSGRFHDFLEWTSTTQRMKCLAELKDTIQCLRWVSKQWSFYLKSQHSTTEPSRSSLLIVCFILTLLE